MVVLKEINTFIAPFVAIALNDNEVKKVHRPQNATSTKDSPMPAIPTILQFPKIHKGSKRNWLV